MTPKQWIKTIEQFKILEKILHIKNLRMYSDGYQVADFEIYQYYINIWMKESSLNTLRADDKFIYATEALNGITIEECKNVTKKYLKI